MESERPKHHTIRSRMPESQTMNASRRSFTKLTSCYPSFLVPHLSDESREFLTCVFMGILLLLMFLWGLTKIFAPLINEPNCVLYNQNDGGQLLKALYERRGHFKVIFG
ncbi:hypothetical protein BO83DRAFT_125363 [Aspergillus eucalypticola CBS 122712]|uniref:Uncharacterized protein n=1 Tax=Aspergillus eucalypticola (strain CBS 122712 / IBT 29274) TaxID=1448314 RepID=A0A317UTX8_ASPEC|nr:uncharacterized protein BO83DRAFT_125363 [Aspergillus eucalypticola CBS 122712]PWY64819.1 hypothetical protein BO83DRAFT_125363 [Aspergillus eucalypticola CBS 122712]